MGRGKTGGLDPPCSNSTNETRIITPPKKPSINAMKRGPGLRTKMPSTPPTVVDNPARAESVSAKPTVLAT